MGKGGDRSATRFKGRDSGAVPAAKLPPFHATHLFVAGKLSPEQHEKTRHDLLEYCKRDTWGTVKLLKRLRELARLT